MLSIKRFLRVILPIIIVLALYQLALAYHSPRGPSDPFAPSRSFMAQRQANGYIIYDEFVYLPLVMKGF
jgi:hypothetical protein